jgi:type I restriction enzyme S subunit
MQDLVFPIPLRSVQDAIVARIDVLFAEIDEGEAALAEARAGVETYRKALLKAAVTGELTAEWRRDNPHQETGEQLLQRILADRRARWHADPRNARKKYTEPAGPDTDGLPTLPDGWAWASAEQLSAGAKGDIIIGPFGSDLKVTDYSVDGVPLVFVRHIRAKDFSGLRPQYITQEKAESLKAHEVISGDLLITKMGDPPGDIAIFPNGRAAIITADCIRWRPAPTVEARFLEIWVQSFWGRAWIAQKTKGVAQRKITLEVFRRMPVALPSLAEQQEIIMQCGRAQASVDDLAAGDVVSMPSGLRQSILAAAFRGQLVA